MHLSQPPTAKTFLSGRNLQTPTPGLTWLEISFAILQVPTFALIRAFILFKLSSSFTQPVIPKHPQQKPQRIAEYHACKHRSPFRYAADTYPDSV